MMASQTSRRTSFVWAIVGGLVLVVVIIAIVLGVAMPQPGPGPTPTAGSSTPSGQFPFPSLSAASEVVDPAVADRGWAPEPITANTEIYIRAALEAASTFDTTKSSRNEWIAYLNTWFTPDTRYAETDRAERMTAAQLELRQGVLLPEQDWDSLATENGRVIATAGEVTQVPVTQDSSGDMLIGTADVTLTYTRAGDDSGETSYDEVVRVSVQVLCGEASVPTPNTAQEAGDCKVVRYFTEPLEP